MLRLFLLLLALVAAPAAAQLPSRANAIVPELVAEGPAIPGGMTAEVHRLEGLSDDDVLGLVGILGDEDGRAVEPVEVGGGAVGVESHCRSIRPARPRGIRGRPGIAP